MLQKKVSQWLTQKKKSNYATRICKICFREIKCKSISDICGNYSICQRCLDEMKPNYLKEDLYGYKLNYLYEYDDKIKELIYQLKACGDIELSSIFLQKQAYLLKILNFYRVIVPIPSYKNKNDERGFNHVVEIFKPLRIEMVNALIKTSNIKQADLGHEKRKMIKNYIGIVEKEKINNKHILLVDDIITSGYTAKSCADLLMKNGAKSVKILAVARTKYHKH